MHFTTIYKNAIAAGFKCDLYGHGMNDKQLSASTIGMHLYYQFSGADSEIKNSVADGCGAVRKSIEKVLKALYVYMRNSRDPNKGLPQYVRSGLTDGTGYLGRLLEAIEETCETQRKRRRLNANVESRTNVNHCTDAQGEAITSSLLETFIDQGWAFTAIDSKKTKFYKTIRLLRPGYAESHFPSRKVLSGRYLDAYFGKTKRKVEAVVSKGLRKGYGTLIFDGWEDVTGASVVNILLRTDQGTDLTRKIIFLDSVFTGVERMDSDAYARLIEGVMSRFGGLSRICAVTSDSATACVNAKSAIMTAYPFVVSVPDQAHLADLLMKDIGKVPWVKHILDKVAVIAKETRGKRKLLARLKENIEAYNAKIRCKCTGPTRWVSCYTPNCGHAAEGFTNTFCVI